MMNPMYGGMSPALMAQWYQRMQAYYATMGRGMMPAMGMGNPMMAMPNMNRRHATYARTNDGNES
jgi:hypothetical protein